MSQNHYTGLILSGTSRSSLLQVCLGGKLWHFQFMKERRCRLRLSGKWQQGRERIHILGVKRPPSEEMANYAPGCEPAELKRSSTKVNAYPQAASRVGCHDMAGNVNEWCIDNVSNNYNWDYYRINPVYLIQEGLPHIVKGGSGLHDEDNLRCASRDSYDPGLRDNIVGFRCVFLGESFNGR